MYGYEWTGQNGIYRLSVNSKIEKEIRPVFKEELDYFGFNEHWTYPDTDAPLLWAEGIRRYILNGTCVAEATGGGFYTKPTIKIYTEGLNLEPIDVDALWKENERLMLGLEKTSMDFIRKTHDKYEKQGMAFAVAFSGGKDSLVLLDLVSRTLSPDEFSVVFSNTGMELSTTIQSVEKAKKHWSSLMSRDIYTMRARNYILSRLENFGNKAPIIIENYTIEHIMPQNTSLSPEWQHDLGVNWKEIQKTYIHTIGNLTLTAYNSEMSDRPFMDKMNMPGGFKESALRLNAYLVKLTEWNEDHIKERAQQLAAKAVQIWPYPSLTNADLAPYTAEEKSAPKYTLETYDINAFTKILFETLDRRIMNLSPAVKREYKKLYIAYKLDTNFVDIVVQKQRLRISVNMKFSEVYDPNGICRDVTGLGRWGNGDVELFMEHTSDIDRVMEIIEQSYKLQAD